MRWEWWAASHLVAFAAGWCAATWGVHMEPTDDHKRELIARWTLELDGEPPRFQLESPDARNR